jgi:hypothetical protein
MGLAFTGWLVVVILLQVVMLLRGKNGRDDESAPRFAGGAGKRVGALERELREELARGRREDAEERFAIAKSGRNRRTCSAGSDDAGRAVWHFAGRATGGLCPRTEPLFARPRRAFRAPEIKPSKAG